MLKLWVFLAVTIPLLLLFLRGYEPFTVDEEETGVAYPIWYPFSPLDLPPSERGRYPYMSELTRCKAPLDPLPPL